MKAFDTITPLHYESQKSLNETSIRKYFTIDKKQSIQIPINKKVQIQAISHEIRKPKVHIIKTKQPQVHILQAKSKDVLGFDTGSEEWGHHYHQGNLNNNGGLFNAIRNANIFNRHHNQMQQQNLQNQQQQTSINQPSRNPFAMLKQQLFARQLPTPQEQPLPMNSLGYGLQGHMMAMQQQQQENKLSEGRSLAEIQQQIPNPQQQPLLPQINRQNLFQSHVQKVELQNIPAAFQQQQKLEQSLGDRFLNFFRSFKNKSTQSQNQNQQLVLGHSLPQNLECKQHQVNNQTNNLTIEKSEVNQFEIPMGQSVGNSRQMKLQESIVEQYHDRN